MKKCALCNKEFKTLKGLSCHLSQIYKIDLKKYYIDYIDKNNKCSICGNEKELIGEFLNG